MQPLEDACRVLLGLHGNEGLFLKNLYCLESSPPFFFKSKVDIDKIQT